MRKAEIAQSTNSLDFQKTFHRKYRMHNPVMIINSAAYVKRPPNGQSKVSNLETIKTERYRVKVCLIFKMKMNS